MHQRYRKDYDGEFVVVDTIVAENSTSQKREWIPNAVENHHVSGRAVAIATRDDSKFFKHQRLARHRGGLLGQKRLQTYGTGDMWKDMRFDFFAATQPELIAEIDSARYHQDTTVYTNARNCLAYPGHFYLVPHLPSINQIALPIYLAAFDGHSEVFLLGYNVDSAGGDKNWITDVDQVFKTYDSTRFYLVTRQNLPGRWLSNSNVSVMDYRKFITYCDI